jgi:hypothetical protein
MHAGADADRIAGRLTIAPGTPRPIAGARPAIDARVLARLTQGRRAALVPDLIGSVFTLCACAQRSTARRAVAAALGAPARAGAYDDDALPARDRLATALATAREHLQRLALDLPAQWPAGGIAADPLWLRDAPLLALPARVGLAAPEVLQAASAALPAWLERRVLGLPACDWLAAWEREGGAWLARWSARCALPAARWLAAVRDDALAIRIPGRALALDGDRGADAPAAAPLAASAVTQATPTPVSIPPTIVELAAALRADDRFAQRPLWRGAPAETGSWTRTGQPGAAATAWDRLGARLADLARIALGDLPACGAAAPAPCEGIAWTEMSRGLLVHWVQLDAAGRQDAHTSRVGRYAVLAPTEWNFHPEGGLAQALRTGAVPPRLAALAVLALDPCVAFDLRVPAPQEACDA